MTRSEILGLTAGREADAIVAEMVMGWTKLEGRDAYMGPTRLGRPRQAPMFTQDANAAALVLAEVERRDIRARFLDEFKLMGLDKLYIQPGDVQSYVLALDWHLLTASPLAICQAALLAMLEADCG